MKRITSLCAVVVVLLLVLSGCQMFLDSDSLYRERLSDEEKTKIYNRILIDYNDFIYWENVSGESTEPYYGTINGCIILQAIRVEQLSFGPACIEIAGYTFKTHQPIGLYAYRNGEASTLQEAYEKGWLTKEQIGKIYEMHQIIYKEYLTAHEESSKTKEVI